MTVLTLTTGTCFIMWLGEQITERGIGNGMSLIIYAGIVVNFPHAVMHDDRADAHRAARARSGSLLLMVADGRWSSAAIIFVERGHRRVTVQYAKRVVGRRMCGGSSTHIPLKVNTGGVIPVIFASSILAFPATIAQMFRRHVGRSCVRDQVSLRHAAPQPAVSWPASSSSRYFYTGDHLQSR